MKPILAYRAWSLTIEGKLRSVVWPTVWQPNEVSMCELRAETKCLVACRVCDNLSGGATYNGFHAHKTLASTMDYASLSVKTAIVGGVYLWGTVEEHGSGYRATCAYPAWVKAWCAACSNVTADAKVIVVPAGHVVVCRDCLPSRAYDTYDIGAKVSRLYNLV